MTSGDPQPRPHCALSPPQCEVQRGDPPASAVAAEQAPPSPCITWRVARGLAARCRVHPQQVGQQSRQPRAWPGGGPGTHRACSLCRPVGRSRRETGHLKMHQVRPRAPLPRAAGHVLQSDWASCCDGAAHQRASWLADGQAASVCGLLGLATEWSCRRPTRMFPVWGSDRGGQRRTRPRCWLRVTLGDQRPAAMLRRVTCKSITQKDCLARKCRVKSLKHRPWRQDPPFVPLRDRARPVKRAQDL